MSKDEKCSICKESDGLESLFADEWLGVCERCTDIMYDKAWEMLKDPPEYLWDCAVDLAKETLWFENTQAPKEIRQK